MEDDTYLIRLYCHDCENNHCEAYPIGSYVGGIKEKRGCTRIVSEENYAKFEHYEHEVWPFFSKYSPQKQKQVYQEVINFLENMYSMPIGTVYNSKGEINTRLLSNLTSNHPDKE